MNYLNDLFKDNTYYEEKIIFLIKEYKKLFVKMLADKGSSDANIDEVFIVLARKVKKLYPELENRIFSLIYYYGSEEDSEEKLYYMLKLYKIIKEKIYGK